VSFTAAAFLLALAPALGAQQQLTLRQAVELAQGQGQLAHAAVSTREAARQRDKAFAKRLLPQVTLGGNQPTVAYNSSIASITQPDGTIKLIPQQNTRTSLNMQIGQTVPLTGGTVGVNSGLQRTDVVGTNGLTRTYNSTPVSLFISQPILRSNAAKWDAREQNIRADEAEQAYLEAREDVAVQTVTAFMDLYAARTTQDALTANVAVNDTLYRANQIRYQVGKIVQSDLLQSELQLLRARAALDAAKLEAQRALSAFIRAINAAPGTLVDVADPSDVPAFDPDTAVAVAEALRNQSLMLDIDLRKDLAARAVNEARLNSGVGGTLQAQFGFNKSAPLLGDAYNNLLQAKGLTFFVSVPITTWGAHGADVQAARADQQALDAQTRASRDQAAEAARFAALQLTVARSNLAISAKADSVAAQAFSGTYYQYVLGQIAIDIVFLQQASKDAARVEHLNALRNYWLAYYTLRKLTLYDFEQGRPIR
jgi:outer membrane protein TolC